MDANNNHYRAFAQLLIGGADLDSQTRYYDEKTKRIRFDKTALMFAIILNKKLFTHALLLYGANRDIRDRLDNIPWYVAKFEAHFETYEKE